ncbi:DUF6583 family protein [Oceanobacillus salinisoli]|uniref:DUF6583 family protein n=1 Tax=Oceanobacillus salinisoli TaxID=2678611 RepID=UPI0012E2294E|nr:DUF6583 family protein [Oceanobacillus salinisoli]
MGESNKKKGVIAIAIAAVLIVGGSVAAFMLTNTTPKQSYFLAEKNTIDYLGEQFSERYGAEMEWNDESYENPAEQALELSAEYNGPTETEGFATVDPAQIINNSSISLTAQTDMENKQIASELALNFAGLELEGLSAYITDEKIMVGLPFIEEYLQIMDEDFGPLLNEIDPITFTGEESLELDTLFEGTNIMSEEDSEYLQTEYVEFIYHELPDEAFETSNETIDIQGQTLDTEKIDFQLTEQQVKDLLSTVFEKMENDDRLKEILHDQFAAGQIGGPALDADLDQMMLEFEDALAEAKEGIQDFQIPEGLTSTIWVYRDLIVQRDLFIELGSHEDDLVSFGMKGTQLLEDAAQQFNYNLDFADTYSSGSMTLTGNLSWEEDQVTDSINLTFGEYNLSYDGTESLQDGTRDFNRVFSYSDSMTEGNLVWDGSSTFNHDQMNAEHRFSVETSDLGNLLSLQLVVDGKIIDTVEMPAEELVKDLGSMDSTELMNYFEMELTPSFQQWLFGIMAGGTGF